MQAPAEPGVRISHPSNLYRTMSRQPSTLSAIVFIALSLTACAHRGSRSPDARPVLYPNATFKQIGENQALQDIDVCMGEARRAGLTPEENDSAVGRGAARGAAVGGTIGAVGSMVNGRGMERVLESGVKGAAVGGAAGAVAGSFRGEQPNMTYRHFVQRCLSEKGLEVIGWQ